MGAVLLVGILITGVAVFYIGNVGDVFGRRYELVTLMESASGLQPGAVVQVAGQNVGQVERVDLIAPEARGTSPVAVSIRLGINVEVRDQIRRGSTARVRTQGLLGDRLIDIEPGAADSAVLASGDTLPAAPAVAFDEMLAQAAEAVQSLTSLSNDLAGTLARVAAGEGSLGRLLVDDALYDGLLALNDQLGAVLGPIGEGDGSLGLLLSDRALYDQLASAAARIDTLTGAMVSEESSLGRMMASDSLYRALASSAARADSMLALVEGGEGALGRLVGDEELYEEMLRVVVDLTALLAEVRANPERFLPPFRVF